MSPPRWLHWPSAAAGSNVIDTFTDSAITWSAGNAWYTDLEQGTWDNGSANGTYVQIDAGSVIQTGSVRVEVGSADIQIGDILSITIGTGDTKTATWTGGTAGNGDYFFGWDGGAVTIADIEPGGNFGWGTSNLVIELIRP